MGSKLRPKYKVFRILDNGMGVLPEMLSAEPDNVDSPFVLMPHKDPAACYALLAYAQVCEDDLAVEICEWAKKIVSAPPKYGSQGERNRVHMKIKQLGIML